MEVFRRKRSPRGFTLIELMVVIAIIALLAALGAQRLDSARGKARDTRRLADMQAIETALKAYMVDHEGIPFVPPSAQGPSGMEDRYLAGGSDDLGCFVGGTGFTGEWDRSSFDGGNDGRPFLAFLVQLGYLGTVPVDPLNDIRSGDGCAHGTGHTYAFYALEAGSSGCDPALGDLFLLGITDMESRQGPWPGSPNAGCGGSPGLQYNQYFEWFDVIPEAALRG